MWNIYIHFLDDNCHEELEFASIEEALTRLPEAVREQLEDGEQIVFAQVIRSDY